MPNLPFLEVRQKRSPRGSPLSIGLCLSMAHGVGDLSTSHNPQETNPKTILMPPSQSHRRGLPLLSPSTPTRPSAGISLECGDKGGESGGWKGAGYVWTEYSLKKKSTNKGVSSSPSQKKTPHEHLEDKSGALRRTSDIFPRPGYRGVARPSRLAEPGALSQQH